MKSKLPILEIEIQRATTSTTTPQDEQLQKWVESALSGIKDKAVLAIRIVDSEEGQQINRQYRDKDYATNVLSFPADLPLGIADSQLGDLLICAPVVASEAKEQGKKANDPDHPNTAGNIHFVARPDADLDRETLLPLALQRKRRAGRRGGANNYTTSLRSFSSSSRSFAT